MGFLGMLLGKKNEQGDKKTQANGFKEIGEFDCCPYCKEKLDKVPKRKSKCPSCGDYIHSRTRPFDNKKVLVTANQKDEIELEWTRYREANEEVGLMENDIYARARTDLEKQFGKEPPLNDVKWRVCNQRIIEYSTKRQWGLYRNNKLEMANILQRENKLKISLSTLCEVCYLDLNGCNNLPTTDGKPMEIQESNEFGIKDFDTSSAFLAPGIIRMVAELIEKLSIDEKETKKIFIVVNEKTKPLKNMPLFPEEAWNILIKELKKND